MSKSDKKQAFNLETPYGKGLVISPTKLSGPEQMAADVIMLEKATTEENFAISIRFYKWDGIWLSIGHNQKQLPCHWIHLIKERKINIVRRPSGGNAVLHSGGLTYSLVWKSAPREKLRAYYLASQWLINCFSDLGLPLKFGKSDANTFSQNCFALSTQVDLIDNYGFKRIGSAQFWRKGNLLQHGQILLDPPKNLWLSIFNSSAPEPAPKSFPRKNLERLLTDSLINYWPGLSWQRQELSSKDLSTIKRISANYCFSSDKDINPEEIIPSTNFPNDIPNG